MSAAPYIIPREVLDKIFGGNPRARNSFEKFQSQFQAVDEATTQLTADTQKLQDAAFVTLSANAELPNERVLELGRGLASEVTADKVRVSVSDNVPTVGGGFRITFAASGDGMLGLPPSGTLANQEWVESRVANVGAGLSNYADDAAAAAGGIAVGELYRTGSAIKVRVA